MLKTLKLNNKKWKKSSFHEEKSLLGLTPVFLAWTIHYFSFEFGKRFHFIKELNYFNLDNYYIAFKSKLRLNIIKEFRTNLALFKNLFL